MDVKQIYELTNTVASEVLGKSNVLNEDLSNLVDVGTELFNANAVDNYVKTLVNRIGRVIFVDRPYTGRAPSVYRDAWEYGSVVEKISFDLPDAEESETWELVDRASYDPNIFYKPQVSVKFFNSKTTFEIPMSFTTLQIKESFTGVDEANRFLSALRSAMDKALTIRMDGLIMRTINNFVGETIYNEYPESSTYSSKSGIRAVNLLYLYNTQFNISLTVADCMTDKDFIRFASYMVGLYASRMRVMSALFNMGNKDRFTPNDRLHLVMLSNFLRSADVYLYSDTFHNDLVKLPEAEEIPYWQGSGTDYAFANVSKIKISTSGGHTVDVSGILAVMFDHDALGVCNDNRRVTVNYNPKAEFYNNWYKADAMYYNDFNENFVVFFVA